MITIIVVLSLMVDSCLSLYCSVDYCYGTLQELQTTHIEDKEIVYFVKPTEYIEPCSSSDCLSLLKADSRLDCKGNVSTISTTSWSIPGGVSLLPSCTKQQTITRLGPPSEDVSSLDSISLARVVIEEKQTPCSVIKIGESHISISNFTVDNSECVSHMSDVARNTYLSSVLNLYPRRRHLSEITIDSLVTYGGEVSIHIGSLSKRFPTLSLSRVKIGNIGGGHLFTEMVCGDIQIYNISKWVLQDIPSHQCVTKSALKSNKTTPLVDTRLDNSYDVMIERVSEKMGPLQLIHFYSSISESSQSNGNCMRCYLILVISLLLTIMVTTISCVCYFSTHSNVTSMVESGVLKKCGKGIGKVVGNQRKRIPWEKNQDL